MPHEISQSASLVPWFKDYPYPYVSADATPLFIIAMNDYAMQSGDLAFARDNGRTSGGHIIPAFDLRRAGLRADAGVGHGWVEGGPLLPVKNEYYQAGLGVEALRALSNWLDWLAKTISARTRNGIRAQQGGARSGVLVAGQENLRVRTQSIEPARR